MKKNFRTRIWITIFSAPNEPISKFSSLACPQTSWLEFWPVCRWSYWNREKIIVKKPQKCDFSFLQLPPTLSPWAKTTQPCSFPTNAFSSPIIQLRFLLLHMSTLIMSFGHDYLELEDDMCEHGTMQHSRKQRAYTHRACHEYDSVTCKMSDTVQFYMQYAL